MGKKRRCLLWAALLALVMLVPSPGWACEHYGVSVQYEDLQPAGNKVESQVGVPGYSGDLVCPLCGQVCERGVVIPAKPAPADHPAASDAETGEAGTVQVAQEPVTPPEQPVQLIQPEEPVQEKQPVQPEQPDQAEPPAQAVQLVQPEQPAQAEQSAQQELPAVEAELPAAGTEPSAAEAEVPARAKEPQPVGEKTEKLTEISGGERPPQVKEEAAPIPAAANEKAESAGTSSGGGGGTAKKTEEKKAPALNFSFRRTRFKPEPGIRAEAAGVLIWPVSVSPFQQMNRR